MKSYHLILVLSLIACLCLIGSASALTWTSANGCWTATDGTYNYTMWNATGANTWTVPAGVTQVDYLVVAGAGSGCNGAGGGGGGAGGFLNGTGLSVSGTVNVVVGAGGASGNNPGITGDNSTFSSITAVGGGGGGSSYDGIGLTGGSGGGSSAPSTTDSASSSGGSNVSGQGFAGGKGYNTATWHQGGGGGGAGSSGTNAPAGTYNAGNGGNGVLNNITGTATWYAAGGGGGIEGNGGTVGASTNGIGGVGGIVKPGIPTSIPSAGVNGTGSGGGGGNKYTGSNAGGSGIVIIKYRIPATTPVSSFTPSGVTTGLSPLTVTFNDTSTGSPTTWNWSYQGIVAGNNTAIIWATTQNTTGTFNAGNYSISLNVTNSYGYNVSTQSTWINVTNSIPIVSFTANVTSGVAPVVVAFNDTSTGNMTSRFWDFGDLTNSTIASPTHTYSTAGTYTVNLTETNLDVSNSTIKNITVYGAANSQFSSFNTAGTAPFSTYLYDQSTNLTPGPDTYYWDFGDGNTSTSQSLYYTWNITGTYSVNHSVSNGVSTSWNNKSAYIVVGTPTPPVVAPVASFYGGPQTGGVPLRVFFTDVSSNTPTGWNWSFGDGTFNETQNPEHVYSTSGFKTVNLTATNSAGSNITSRAKFVKVS